MYIAQLHAIMNIQNVCLLGKDFPEVSFAMMGANPYVSYGRGSL